MTRRRVSDRTVPGVCLHGIPVAEAGRACVHGCGQSLQIRISGPATAVAALAEAVTALRPAEGRWMRSEAYPNRREAGVRVYLTHTTHDHNRGGSSS